MRTITFTEEEVTWLVFCLGIVAAAKGDLDAPTKDYLVVGQETVLPKLTRAMQPDPPMPVPWPTCPKHQVQYATQQCPMCAAGMAGPLVIGGNLAVSTPGI